MVRDHWRPAWAAIDMDAARHNAALIRRLSGPAALCAVVKADAYGHGALAMARATLDGGARWLAVALVEEGVALRDAGIDAPILLLSEPPADAMGEAVAHRLVPTVYTDDGLHALVRAVAAAETTQTGPVDVHLKVDTGMHRVGVDASAAVPLANSIVATGRLRLGAVWTHLAVADGEGPVDTEFTTSQLDCFDSVLAHLAAAGHRPPIVHIANSAGAIAYPDARRDLVRCGIALYGALPSPSLDSLAELEGERLHPVLSLRARVALVRDLGAGERPSYGRCRPLAERSTVAVVPIGYADGVPRRLFDGGGDVLIGGRRRPLAGVVTMDQIVVDCGPVGSAPVSVGDEVVLLGKQGVQEITANEWARLLGTISYEVLCGIGPRVPRILVERGGLA